MCAKCFIVREENRRGHSHTRVTPSHLLQRKGSKSYPLLYVAPPPPQSIGWYRSGGSPDSLAISATRSLVWLCALIFLRRDTLYSLARGSFLASDLRSVRTVLLWFCFSLVWLYCLDSNSSFFYPAPVGIPHICIETNAEFKSFLW